MVRPLELFPFKDARYPSVPFFNATSLPAYLRGEVAESPVAALLHTTTCADRHDDSG